MLSSVKEGERLSADGTSSRNPKASDYEASSMRWETEGQPANVISFMIWGVIVTGGCDFLGLLFTLSYFLVITDSSVVCISSLIQ